LTSLHGFWLKFCSHSYFEAQKSINSKTMTFFFLLPLVRLVKRWNDLDPFLLAVVGATLLLPFLLPSIKAYLVKVARAVLNGALIVVGVFLVVTAVYRVLAEVDFFSLAAVFSWFRLWVPLDVNSWKTPALHALAGVGLATLGWWVFRALGVSFGLERIRALQSFHWGPEEPTICS